MPTRRALARSAAALLAGVALALPAAAAAADDLQVTWDQDLAFEWDRASYEKTLLGLVRASEAEISGWLGWRRSRPLQIRVVTRAHYEALFGASGWKYGAHYDGGVVHVNGGAKLNGWFAGLLTHELTHVWLDDRGTGGRLPTWLNEGLAERLGFRARGQQDLDSTQRQELEVALDQRTLLPLADGGAMTNFRYLQAFAAVLFLERKVGKEKLLAVVRRTLGQETFEQALDAELRWTPRRLEEEFAAWVDHLQ